MYLVARQGYGTSYFVFTVRDPREDGFDGEVIDDVHLDYDMNRVHAWSEGQGDNEPCMGRDPGDPKRYKVFRNRAERDAERFDAIEGDPLPLVFHSWKSYRRLMLEPPDPAEVQGEDWDWYDYVDRLDDKVRRWRRRSETPSLPQNGGKSEIAKWVAKQHLIVDGGLREVWYLPNGSPPDEIRLLELNDRFEGPDLAPEPLDFRLDVADGRYRLSVADVSSDQLERIKNDPSRLPSGWSLDGKQVWSRRA